MPQIMVSCGTADVNAYNPELISALKSAKDRDDLILIYEKYDSETVTDAMFAIDNAFLEREWDGTSEEAIEEWLYELYYADFLPVIEERFVHRDRGKAC